MIKPHKDNVEGPFYVGEGCCTACDIPFQLAPELFSYDQDQHCYVSRQPETKEELDRIIRTLLYSEVQCIRYRGKEEDVLRRLGESGDAALADVEFPQVAQLVRTHVTFDVADPTDVFLTAADLAKLFKHYFLSTATENSTYQFSPIESDGIRSAFSYSWFEDDFHDVEIQQLLLPECRWLIVTDHPNTIYDWLVEDKRFCNIRWYTRSKWESDKVWQDTPW